MDLIFSSTRRMLSAWLFIVCLTAGQSSFAQTTNTGFETFKKFVNGEIPIQEAVVHRVVYIHIPGRSLVITNEQWTRFGFQGDTWYSQTVLPTETNPAVFAQSGHHGTIGANKTHLWVASNNSISVAPRQDAMLATSTAEIQAIYGSHMYDAISLRLACSTNASKQPLQLHPIPIKFDGLKYQWLYPVKQDTHGNTLDSVETTGNLSLGSNGLPVSAESSFYFIHFEYDTNTIGIPKSFFQKINGETFALYEFQTLHIGEKDLSQTDGYVPEMFVDNNLSIPVFVVSNNTTHYLTQDGKMLPSTPGIDLNKQRHQGGIFFGAIVILIVFPTLWYWRLRKNKQNDN